MAVTARNNGFRKVAKWIVGAVVVASASSANVVGYELMSDDHTFFARPGYDINGSPIVYENFFGKDFSERDVDVIIGHDLEDHKNFRTPQYAELKRRDVVREMFYFDLILQRLPIDVAQEASEYATFSMLPDDLARKVKIRHYNRLYPGLLQQLPDYLIEKALKCNIYEGISPDVMLEIEYYLKVKNRWKPMSPEIIRDTNDENMDTNDSKPAQVTPTTPSPSITDEVIQLPEYVDGPVVFPSHIDDEIIQLPDYEDSPIVLPIETEIEGSESSESSSSDSEGEEITLPEDSGVEEPDDDVIQLPEYVDSPIVLPIETEIEGSESSESSGSDSEGEEITLPEDSGVEEPDDDVIQLPEYVDGPVVFPSHIDDEIIQLPDYEDSPIVLPIETEIEGSESSESSSSDSEGEEITLPEDSGVEEPDDDVIQLPEYVDGPVVFPSHIDDEIIQLPDYEDSPIVLPIETEIEGSESSESSGSDSEGEEITLPEDSGVEEPDDDVIQLPEYVDGPVVFPSHIDDEIIQLPDYEDSPIVLPIETEIEGSESSESSGSDSEGEEITLPEDSGVEEPDDDVIQLPEYVDGPVVFPSHIDDEIIQLPDYEDSPIVLPIETEIEGSESSESSSSDSEGEEITLPEDSGVEEPDDDVIQLPEYVDGPVVFPSHIDDEIIQLPDYEDSPIVLPIETEIEGSESSESSSSDSEGEEITLPEDSGVEEPDDDVIQLPEYVDGPVVFPGHIFDEIDATLPEDSGVEEPDDDVIQLPEYVDGPVVFPSHIDDEIDATLPEDSGVEEPDDDVIQLPEYVDSPVVLPIETEIEGSESSESSTSDSEGEEITLPEDSGVEEPDDDVIQLPEYVDSPIVLPIETEIEGSESSESSGSDSEGEEITLPEDSGVEEPDDDVIQLPEYVDGPVVLPIETEIEGSESSESSSSDSEGEEITLPEDSGVEEPDDDVIQLPEYVDGPVVFPSHIDDEIIQLPDYEDSPIVLPIETEIEGSESSESSSSDSEGEEITLPEDSGVEEPDDDVIQLPEYVDSPIVLPIETEIEGSESSESSGSDSEGEEITLPEDSGVEEPDDDVIQLPEYVDGPVVFPGHIFDEIDATLPEDSGVEEPDDDVIQLPEYVDGPVVLPIETEIEGSESSESSSSDSEGEEITLPEDSGVEEPDDDVIQLPEYVDGPVVLPIETEIEGSESSESSGSDSEGEEITLPEDSGVEEPDDDVIQLPEYVDGPVVLPIETEIEGSESSESSSSDSEGEEITLPEDSGVEEPDDDVIQLPEYVDGPVVFPGHIFDEIDATLPEDSGVEEPDDDVIQLPEYVDSPIVLPIETEIEGSESSESSGSDSEGEEITLPEDSGVEEPDDDVIQLPEYVDGPVVLPIETEIEGSESSESSGSDSEGEEITLPEDSGVEEPDDDVIQLPEYVDSPIVLPIETEIEGSESSESSGSDSEGEEITLPEDSGVEEPDDDVIQLPEYVDSPIVLPIETEIEGSESSESSGSDSEGEEITLPEDSGVEEPDDDVIQLPEYVDGPVVLPIETEIEGSESSESSGSDSEGEEITLPEDSGVEEPDDDVIQLPEYVDGPVVLPIETEIEGSESSESSSSDSEGEEITLPEDSGVEEPDDDVIQLPEYVDGPVVLPIETEIEGSESSESSSSDSEGEEIKLPEDSGVEEPDDDVIQLPEYVDGPVVLPIETEIEGSESSESSGSDSEGEEITLPEDSGVEEPDDDVIQLPEYVDGPVVFPGHIFDEIDATLPEDSGVEEPDDDVIQLPEYVDSPIVLPIETEIEGSESSESSGSDSEGEEITLPEDSGVEEPDDDVIQLPEYVDGPVVFPSHIDDEIDVTLPEDSGVEEPDDDVIQLPEYLDGPVVLPIETEIEGSESSESSSSESNISGVVSPAGISHIEDPVADEIGIPTDYIFINCIGKGFTSKDVDDIVASKPCMTSRGQAVPPTRDVVLRRMDKYNRILMYLPENIRKEAGQYAIFELLPSDFANEVKAAHFNRIYVNLLKSLPQELVEKCLACDIYEGISFETMAEVIDYFDDLQDDFFDTVRKPVVVRSPAKTEAAQGASKPNAVKPVPAEVDEQCAA